MAQQSTEEPRPRHVPRVRVRWSGHAFERLMLTVITLMLIGVVFLAILVTVLRIEQIRDENTFDQALVSQVRPAAEHPVIAPDAAPDERAEAILAAAEGARIQADAALAEARQLTASAEDAQDTVDLLLSFLEGATVLVGIAIGAAAFFGFRNYRDIHDDAVRDQAHLENTQRDVNKALGELSITNKKLDERIENTQRDVNEALGELSTTSQNLDKRIAELAEFRTVIAHAQEIFAQLVLAYQELRLGNHAEAYAAAGRVLALDPNNVQALYLSGWLENQHIAGKRGEALPHLKKAVDLSPNWPSARAALGVIQRRRAVQAEGANRDTLLAEAEYNLKRALLDNPRLLDPNLESFWGPLAGIYRARGDFDEAKKAYQEACRVTPGSSYPAGNLAALYLRDYKCNGAPLQPAIDKFKDTLSLARAELAQTPGDYFILMDIAMSTIILSGHDARKYALEEGHDYFKKALGTGPTDEMLSVTKRGLRNLLDFCPDDWSDVTALLNDLLNS